MTDNKDIWKDKTRLLLPFLNLSCEQLHTLHLILIYFIQESMMSIFFFFSIGSQ